MLNRPLKRSWAMFKRCHRHFLDIDVASARKNMAASSSQSTTAEAVMETAPPLKSHGDNNTGIEGLSKREPAVVLLSPVSGLEPLSWSDDHRLAASTTSSVSLVDLMCDINSSSQNLVLHRSHIPVPDAVYELEAGPKQDVQAIKDKFAKSKDPVISQAIMIDRVISPQCGRLRGVKYSSWSPTGCDPSGRCLLAFLTLENRLTIHSSHKPLQWTCLMDLTQLYGEMLKSRNYSDQNEDSIRDLDELQRRFQMQTAVRMEWSGLCSLQQAQTNSVCKDKSTVLLAVLMENGDVVVWQFSLPILGKESIVSCSTIKSSISSPSALSWWEYEHAGRKMSGLVVGSSVGPVKILPVNLKAVKGHFTLKQPVILWQDEDLIPVHNVKCVTLFHSVQKCNCSLVVAARGPFVFWSLLLISKTGLNVHNSHVTGLHSTPINSMTVNYNDGSVFTCSLDGTVMKLTPAFTGAAVAFKLSEIVLPEGVAGRRIHGISVSANGAYMAVASSEGMTNGLHPVCLTYQVHFIPLRTAEDAAAELLESPVQNLFRKADLLDLLRWQILKDKSIPAFLLDNLDEKLQKSGSVYFWRLKLFALRVLQKSVSKSPVEVAWRPSKTQEKLDEEDEMAESSVLDESGREEVETHSSEEQMERIIQRIQEAEHHLIRENMKKVLGEVYLHTCITQNTCVPAKGLCDFLTEDTANEDRAAKVLIGHVMNKLYKQTFPEHCSLCKDVLPFTDCKRTECKNGHRWLRCVLSYQACQGVTYRRCLLQDSIASVAEPEDPDWIKKILQGSCIFCDFPFY